MASKDSEEQLGELRRRLAEVTAEREALLREIRFLTRQTTAAGVGTQQLQLSLTLSAILPTDSPQPSPAGCAPNRNSTPHEKISLFRSLFRGREDAYARMWVSQRSDKPGYSPVCINEWNRALCGKPRVRCNDCPNRSYARLTDSVIGEHLRGKCTIGLYPMLADETCRLLAIDFDKQSWMEDVSAFVETCRLMCVPVALERSRSGQGGHVWIFFADPIPAFKARQLGGYLLTETMSRRHQLRMDSYDRLIPNQDNLPKAGLGGLIALPLQKGPAARGNSVFVNDEFEPCLDQWAFLASLSRMGFGSVEKLVREATRSGQVIGLPVTTTGEDEQPWNRPPSGRVLQPTLSGPLPAVVEVTLGNLLYVDKNGLPSLILNLIKRLAAFQNPEFYKRQSMRLSTARTPRVISCAEEFPEHVGLPRGCLEELQALLELHHIRMETNDRRSEGREIKVTFHGVLRPGQQAAATDLLSHDTGVFVAPAGLGKTVVASHLIAARGRNTLVLVHRRPLLEQWRAQLGEFLGLDSSDIGQVGDGKDKRSGRIDVAMLQSVVSKRGIKDFVADYGHVIVDECHHLPAVTFEQVLRQVKARFVAGLTATPYRRDGHHPIIMMQCGPVRHVISSKDQAALRPFEHHLVRRDTAFSIECEPTITVQKLYTALASDQERNQQILEDLIGVLEEGRWPILLSERREHLDFFAIALSSLGYEVIVLRGGMGAKQRCAIEEQLAGEPRDKGRVVLATGRYAGEGFDEPRLDTLFLALPVSWKGVLAQYAGRLHRLCEGKTEVRVYDYVDRSNPLLMRMFERRLRGYRTLGYQDAGEGT